MNRVFAYLLRFAVILIGYVAASLAASAFIHIMFLGTADFTAREAPGIIAGSIVFSIPFVALFVAYFVFIPSAIFILIAEVLGRRGWLFYALGGGVIAMIFIASVHRMADPDFEITNPVVILTIVGGGLVGGYCYWLSAGRWAGSWRSRPASAPILPGPSGS